MLIDVGIYNSDPEFYNEGDLFPRAEWYGMAVFSKASQLLTINFGPIFPIE